MAEFAIFDKDVQQRARRNSRRRRSSSMPGSNALVAYDQRLADKSSRRNSKKIIEIDELETSSSSPKYAFVRHKDKDNEDYRARTTRLEVVKYTGATFERAAGTLYYTLRQAKLFCEEFTASFDFETQSLAYWCPRKTMDMLWRARTEWDGVPLVDTEQINRHNRAGPTHHYDKHISALKQAWKDLQNAEPVPRVTLESTRVKLVEIEATTSKLRVTLQDIDELWEVVRADRKRMPSLIRRLNQAMETLDDINPVWNRPEYD